MANDETAMALTALRQAATQLLGAVESVQPVLERMTRERAALERVARERAASRSAENKPAEPESPEKRRHLYWDQEVPRIIGDYQQTARRNKRYGDIAQWIVIVGSVVVTLASGAVGRAGWGWVQGLAVIASFLVASTAGLSAYFKPRERAANARRTADEIEHEATAAALGIGRYKRCQPDEALEVLVEEVERLRAEQQQREQQLEQRPEKQPAAAATGQTEAG